MPPPPMLVALQFMNEQFVMDRSPAGSASMLTAPPFTPAVQDVKVTFERVKGEERSRSITAPSPLYFVMEVNVVFSSIMLSEGREEDGSFEEEMKRECDWSAIDVKLLSEHFRIPLPMDKMEAKWVSEGSEKNNILISMSSPIDVIVQIGDVTDTVRATVNAYNSKDWVEMEIPNPSFTTS